MESWKLVIAGGVIGIAGIAAGAQLFGAHPASAQQAPYRECILARQEALDVNDRGEIEQPRPNRIILVPGGYDVLGGGGASGNQGLNAAVLLCRR